MGRGHPQSLASLFSNLIIAHIPIHTIREINAALAAFPGFELDSNSLPNASLIFALALPPSLGSALSISTFVRGSLNQYIPPCSGQEKYTK